MRIVMDIPSTVDERVLRQRLENIAGELHIELTFRRL
jgi:glycine cleavage system regulatory protein